MKCGMLRNMRRKKRTILNFILTGSLLAGCVSFNADFFMIANATGVSEIEGQIDQRTNQLENINNQIVAMESEQDILQEQIDDLNAEILNMMTRRDYGKRGGNLTKGRGDCPERRGDCPEAASDRRDGGRV